jgi:hypothetical protein
MQVQESFSAPQELQQIPALLGFAYKKTLSCDRAFFKLVAGAGFEPAVPRGGIMSLKAFSSR